MTNQNVRWLWGGITIVLSGGSAVAAGSLGSSAKGARTSMRQCPHSRRHSVKSRSGRSSNFSGRCNQ